MSRDLPYCPCGECGLDRARWTPECRAEAAEAENAALRAFVKRVAAISPDASERDALAAACRWIVEARSLLAGGPK